jgi:hypothetical protein
MSVDDAGGDRGIVEAVTLPINDRLGRDFLIGDETSLAVACIEGRS